MDTKMKKGIYEHHLYLKYYNNHHFKILNI